MNEVLTLLITISENR